MKAVFIEEEPERSKVGGSAPLQSGLGGSGPGSRPLRAPPFIYIYIFFLSIILAVAGPTYDMWDLQS